MPTPIGKDTLNAISGEYLLPSIIDVVYDQTLLLSRLHRSNKKVIAGGTHWEQNVRTSKFAAGGSYSGLDLLTMAPADTVQAMAMGWSQYYVPLMIDGLSLIQFDSPDAVANIINVLSEQARDEMQDHLSGGIYNDGVADPKGMTGLGAIVDDGSNITTYAGLTRSQHPFTQATLTSTNTLTKLLLRQMIGSLTFGAKSPTLILSRTDQYNRYWSLLEAAQEFHPMTDEKLASAGWQNIAIEGIPWTVDPQVPDGDTPGNSKILFLNEECFKLIVSRRADLQMEEWQTPVNQDVIASKLIWAGNLFCDQPRLQGALTDVTGI